VAQLSTMLGQDYDFNVQYTIQYNEKFALKN